MNRLKKSLAFILAFLMIFLTFASEIKPSTAYASDDLILKLHYHRSDANYTNWTVWFWESGKEGKAVSFAEENGEMVATVTLSAGCQNVGYIVRYGEWEKKDIDKDQFIDVSYYTSGTIHYYVESGTEGGKLVDGDDVVKGVKLKSAVYQDGYVEIITSADIEGSAQDLFKLTDKEGKELSVKYKESTKKCIFLIPDTELDEYDTYYVVFNEVNYKVSIPSTYSTDEFEKKYTYKGNDLGAVWSQTSTTFKLWAPTAKEVSVLLYKSGNAEADDLIREVPMTPSENGTWTVTEAGDLNGVYYTYKVFVAGQYVEAVDPYARTTGVNGKRGMIINLNATNPADWDKDKDPNYSLNATDMVIYELHIRDLSSDPSSGIKNVGKYLGLTETGTKTSGGMATGIDHIKELGATHIHLLPIYDFGSVDESKLNSNQFNWGYDPVNYNVPEGSYATDAEKGEVRVAELKQAIQALHQNGISVVMDVVYNHVYNASDFCFNKIVPGYFSRIDANGAYSSGSGCGNDTASERAMVKKYIVDSVNYWADEYHMDGFRFDLVGLLDIETINEIVKTVHEKHPNVKFYGEGWSMSTQATKEDVKFAVQESSYKTPDFAYFSDTIRDAIRGNVFNNTEAGYVAGAPNKVATTVMNFKGLPTWSRTPSQVVNYASCHDNNTLIDRIILSTPAATREEQIMMNNLAASIYLTSQGIPFMQAGEEFLRTKPDGNGGFDHNSYASPDTVNSLKWSTLDQKEYADVFNYYKGLIAFRKAHAALRMTTKEQVSATIRELSGLDKNVVAMQIKDAKTVGDSHDSIVVIYNPNSSETNVTLPEGKWDICINKTSAGTETLATAEGTVTVLPISAMVLVRKDAVESTETDKDKTDSSSNGSIVKPIITMAVCTLVLLAALLYMLNRRKKVN